jgi:hypothetical protein
MSVKTNQRPAPASAHDAALAEAHVVRPAGPSDFDALMELAVLSGPGWPASRRRWG